jgi:hypothetical protein
MSDLFAALHYPYILAFEPTFVEIRHIETGLLVQIIKGNNIQLLFAETPPSTTTYAGSSMGSMYGHPGNHGRPYSGGSIRGSQFGAASVVSYTRGYGHVRDVVLMVSDDRVMTIRLAPFDGASMMTSTPTVIAH